MFAALQLLLGFVGPGQSLAVAQVDTSQAEAVRDIIQAIAQFSQLKDYAALDTLFADDPWVRIVEGSGINHGWADYRDHHLIPELREFVKMEYRFYDIEQQVRDDVAWAVFRYEFAACTPDECLESIGRGTAILERRGKRWVVVHLHTAGAT